jgi:hypothetical protein
MQKNFFRKLSVTVLGRKSLRNNGFKESQIINLSWAPTCVSPALSAVGQTDPGASLELSAGVKAAEAYRASSFKISGGTQILTPVLYLCSVLGEDIFPHLNGTTK